MKAYGNADSLARAEQQVLFEVSADGIARIILNRPEKHNAMTVPMRARLMALIQQCDLDDSVRVVAIKGHGKSFCSGNDDTPQGQALAQRIVCAPGAQAGILLTNLPARGWMHPVIGAGPHSLPQRELAAAAGHLLWACSASALADAALLWVARRAGAQRS